MARLGIMDSSHKPKLECISVIVNPKKGYTECKYLAEFIDHNAPSKDHFVMHWHKNPNYQPRLWYIEDNQVVRIKFIDADQADKYEDQAFRAMIDHIADMAKLKRKHAI